MATAAQVKALVESHGAGDDSRFYATALEVAASAAQSGRTRFAEELRALVETVRTSPPARRPAARGRSAPAVRLRGELARFLAVEHADAGLADLALGAEVAARLRRVVEEQRRQELLRAHGFEPLRKVLLTGPAGTGKATAARALAGELGLPVLAVRLDELTAGARSEAGAGLRLVFDLLTQTRAVCLVDGVEALAAERAPGEDGDGAPGALELFLELLQQDASPCAVVVTTDRPQVLDRAALRGFDVLVDLPLPSAGVVQEVVLRRLRGFDLAGVDWPRVVSTASGLSHGEVATASDLAGKQALLAGEREVGTAALLAALRQRRELLRLAP